MNKGYLFSAILLILGIGMTISALRGEMMNSNLPEEKVVEISMDENNQNKKLIMGPAWLLLGLYFFNLAWKENRLLRELRKHGKTTRATVTYVGRENKKAKYKHQTYEIKAEFFEPFSGKQIIASAQNFLRHPKKSGFIAEDNTVEVLYDPKDLKRCLINPKQSPHGRKSS